MYEVVRGSWPLFLGIALLMLGNGLQGTLLGVRANLEGFPTAVTGLVMSAFYLGLLAGSVIAPRLIGQVGHVRVFAAFAAIASAAVLLHAIFPEPILWITVRTLAGFSFAALYIVAESWLNSQAANQHRGQVMSLYMVVTFGGGGLGQLLLNVADPGGFVLFMLVSVLLSVAVVPMLLTTGPVPSVLPGGRPDIGGLLRTSPLGVAGSFISGAAIGAVFGMGAVFATQSGLRVAEVAEFMFAVLVACMLCHFPIGYLADRFDRRLVLIASAAAGAGLALAAGLTGGLLGLSLLVAACLFAFPLYSVSVAHTNDYLDQNAMVAAAGGLMMVNGIGAALGPFAASIVMTGFGPGGFPIYLAAVLGLLATFGVYRTFRRPAVPLDEQGPTVAIARATPVGTMIAQTTALQQMEKASEESEQPEETGTDEAPPTLV